jgi:hypothetical protein
VELDDSIDRGRVTYIGGGDPLGSAPGEVAAHQGRRHLGPAPSREAAPRVAHPCLTLMDLQHLYRIGGAGPTVPIQLTL